MFPSSSSEEDQIAEAAEAAGPGQPQQSPQPQSRPRPPAPVEHTVNGRKTKPRDAIIRASLAEEQQRKSFKELLSAVVHGVETGLLEARLFCWERLYDETPTYCTAAYLQETGDLLYSSESSKVMASKLRLGMCLYLKPGVRGDLPRYHLLHGTLSTPLVPMENQQGPIVRKAIVDSMCWSSEEASMLKVFARKIAPELIISRNQ